MLADKPIIFRESAPCKVNLFLHLLGERVEGMYPLQSLLAFAKIGVQGDADAVTFLPTPSHKETRWNLHGIAAKHLPQAPDENLCWRAFCSAFALLRQPLPGGTLSLSKNLPVGAGLGGGSSDAAAALRLVARLSKRPLSTFQTLATRLGSDVPACTRGQTCSVEGSGTIVNTKRYTLEHRHLVLVVPPLRVSTQKIYDSVTKASLRIMTKKTIPSFVSTVWLVQQQNALQEVCCHIFPQVRVILRKLQAQEACKLARMSGSGGACFGLFPTRAFAQKGAKNLTFPHHWIRVMELEG